MLSKFNKDQWGVDKLVRFDLGAIKSYMPVAESWLTPKQAADPILYAAVEQAHRAVMELA